MKNIRLLKVNWKSGLAIVGGVLFAWVALFKLPASQAEMTSIPLVEAPPSTTCTPGALQAWALTANYPTVIETPAVGSDGTVVYSAGGFNGATATSSFHRYNPGTNTWTTLPSMPGPVYAARGVYAASTNSFYVIFGLDGSDAVRNTAYIYNVGTNSWSTSAPLPPSTDGYYFSNVAYYPANGKIYVFGGFTAGHFPSDELFIYDPVANTWVNASGSPGFGIAGSATSINGQFIYMAGNWNAGSGSTVHLRYDILTNTYASMAPVPVPVFGANGGAIGGFNYMVGGGNPFRPGNRSSGLPGLASLDTPDVSYNTTYIYNVAANTWSTGPNTNSAHAYGGGTTIGARLFIVAGYNGTTDTNTVEITSTSCSPCGGDFRVLLVTADSAQPTTLRDSLLLEPGITAVDLFDARTVTPTLAQLQQYDIVVPMSNSGWADQTALGNNLNAYLTNAGVVVALNFDWFGGPQSILGNWLSNSPFNNPAATHFVNGSLGTCTYPLLCSGVSTLNSFYRETATLAAGATQAATWNDATPLMAYKGRAIGLTAYLGDNPANFSGQYARVIANAGRWLNPGNYTYTTSTGSIVPGTTDTGNHTDDASTVIALPFSYQLYDQTFSSVSVGSNGHLTFGMINDGFNPSCIPITGATYAIGPYWTDQCTGPCTGVTGTSYGIFTSTSGSAPNRIFNIEWRTAYFNSGGAGIPLNYEVRLFEGQTAFDVIYGAMPASFTPPAARKLSVGVQQSSTTQYTLEGCDSSGGGSPPVTSGQLYHYTLTSSCPMDLSGATVQCAGASSNPLAGVTMTLTGAVSAATLTDGSGNYSFGGLTMGMNYTVTPTKAARTPGSSGINTADVVAAQRHFLNMTPLTGCRLTAGDVNASGTVNTQDVVAIQRFFLGLSTGLGNCGKYGFTPASRSYAPLSGAQSGQGYNTIVFGDCATPYANPRDGGPMPDAPGDDSIVSTLVTVALPDLARNYSRTNLVTAVTASPIHVTSNMVGFQGDITFDERVVSFQSEPVRSAGLTDGNWNVSGNILDGPGPIRTLRISAYSLDGTPLSGSGTLFELLVNRTGALGASQLTWAAAPNNFVFIDADLNMVRPREVK